MWIHDGEYSIEYFDFVFQGKLFTSIEAAADFNGLCLVPNTGMIFAANEDPKIQTYYIPVSIYMHFDINCCCSLQRLYFSVYYMCQ
jgi:hypothetical protein